jgi:hypothetical protein
MSKDVLLCLFGASIGGSIVIVSAIVMAFLIALLDYLDDIL